VQSVRGTRKESKHLTDKSAQEGKRIGGYRLLSLLGKGGFGDVYLGERLHDQAQVAIKILHNTGLTHPEDVKEFINEARMFRLQHPHIVPVLDFGIDRDNTPFLVMQYAAHGTLRQRHAPGTRLAPHLVADYVSQVASALQYAHDQQIIHRDVKPENMLLNSDDQVMLSDFGIATVIHSTPSTTDKNKTIDGTTYYIAPEQIQGIPCPASDQYALGIVAYEWLSGNPPFEGHTPLEIGMQHLTATPPSLCDQVPSLSPQIETVILKALAKDPDSRYPSIQAFADALQQATKTQDEQPLPKVPTRRLSSHRLVSLDGSNQASPPEDPIAPETPRPQSPIETEPITPPQIEMATPLNTSARIADDETKTILNTNSIIDWGEIDKTLNASITTTKTDLNTSTSPITTEDKAATPPTTSPITSETNTPLTTSTTDEGKTATTSSTSATTAESEMAATTTRQAASSPQPSPQLPTHLPQRLLIPGVLLFACILIIASMSIPSARNRLQDGSIQAPAIRLHAIEAHPPDYQDTLTNAQSKTTMAAFWSNYDGCHLSTSGYLVYSTRGQQFCHELGKSYIDFAARVNMTIITGIAGALVFRDQDTAHQYGGYVFEVFTNGHYLISDLNHILYAADSPAIKQGFNSTNQLAVVAQGSHLSFFVNDTFLIEITDTKYTEGPFSLAAFQGNYPSCSVNFSNISVWSFSRGTTQRE
jgi:serine/threonine protein kinase